MENNTALATINTEEIGLIVNGAPDVLQKNLTSVTKAKDAGTALLDTIAGEGMSDELDAACNDYQVKVKKTLEAINERRKPITQILDFIKKKFTELEAEIDPKSPGGVYIQVQNHRNAWAKQKQDEIRRREAEAQRRLMMEKETIRLKSDCQQQLDNYFNAFLSRRIQLIHDLFNEVTLEKYEELKTTIGTFPDSYPHEHYDSFAPSLHSTSLDRQSIEQIITDTRKGKFGIFVEQFRSKIQEVKHTTLDRLPSRQQELREIAEANRKAAEAAAAAKSAAEKEEAERQARQAQRMKAEAEERQKAEQARLEREEQERAAASAKAASESAQANMTEALFAASQEVAAAPAQTAAVIEGWSIDVIHHLGWMLIATFYFEREGKNEDMTKLEKKTLGSMKKFAESWAKKHGEKISSPYVKYTEVVKAVAKKQSA